MENNKLESLDKFIRTYFKDLTLYVEDYNGGYDPDRRQTGYVYRKDNIVAIVIFYNIEQHYFYLSDNTFETILDIFAIEQHGYDFGESLNNTYYVLESVKTIFVEKFNRYYLSGSSHPLIYEDNINIILLNLGGVSWRQLENFKTFLLP